MANDDVAWVDVLPSMAGFGPALTKGLAGIGVGAGKAFGIDFTRGMSAGLKASQAQTQTASRALAQARNAEATAAERTNVAELKLAELRKKGNATASQTAAAEARLAQAQRAQATAADGTTLATERLTTAQGEQEVIQKRAGSSATVAKSSILGIGVAALAVAGYVGDKAVKAAADFQTQLVRLTTSAGETKGNLDLVSKGVLQMSGQVGTSAKDLATGLYTIESAGYHGAAGLTVLKAAAQGAKAENAELGTVANAVTDILTDYHLPALQAAGVTSMLVETAAQGKTTFEDLAGAMSNIAPLASAARIPLQDMLGVLSEMTAHGVSADQATQNMANAIRSLSNPSSVMTQELSQLGIRSDDLAKSLSSRGLSGSMNLIVDTILHKMGPSGAVLLSTFNQSKIAAEDANKEFQGLPKNLQKVALAYEQGKISSRDWTLGLKSLSAPQASLLKQWAAMENSSHGFSTALKSGGTSSQSFTQALSKATGNATSMSVALQITGENSAATATKINNIANATDEAGYNVKGWSDIQKTFNQRMAEAKDALGAAGISIGQSLLPAVTSVAKVFAGFANDIAGHTGTLKTLLFIVAGIGAAFVLAALGIKTYTLALRVMKAAQIIWIALTQGMTAAQAELTAATDLNPMVLIITLVLVALAALAFGIVELVKHWSAVWGAIKAAAETMARWFSTTFVNFFVAVWHLIESGAETIGRWFSTTFVRPFVAAFNGIKTAANAVASAFEWLWSTVLRPVFNAIGIGARVLFAILFTIVFIPLTLLLKLVGYVAMELWNHAIAPAFRAIGALAMWLWNNAIHPAFTFINNMFNAMGRFFIMVYNTFIAPVFRFIGNMALWLWHSVFVPFGNGVMIVIRDVAGLFRWLWTNAVQPVLNFISARLNWLRYSVLDPFGAGVIAVLKAVGGWFVWLWNHSIGWLIGQIHTAMPVLGTYFRTKWNIIVQDLKDVGGWFVWLWNHSIGWLIGRIVAGFGNAVSAIGTAWNKIKGIVAAPINFVITQVYDGGIRWLWNKVISAVGLPKLELPYAAPVKFATGGIVPGGYSRNDNVLAHLRSGEGVLTPEAVGMLGGPSFVYSANAQAGGPHTGGPAIGPTGSPAFAGGGVVGSVLSFAGNVAKNVADIVTNPVRFVESKLGQSPIAQMMAHMPATLISKTMAFLGDKVKALADLQAPHDPGQVGKITGQAAALLNQAIALTGVGPHDAWFNGMNTLIWRESGWNPNAINKTDINAKRGTPSEGLAQVIAPTFGAYRLSSLPDNPFNPLANIVAAIRYILVRYHSIGNVQQANSSLPPKGYDSGGYLQPGWNNVYNGLGVPEPVLTPAQLASVGSDGASSDGGEFTLIGGQVEIVGDGLHAVISGRLKKTSGSAARRVQQGFRRP